MNVNLKVKILTACLLFTNNVFAGKDLYQESSLQIGQKRSSSAADTDLVISAPEKRVKGQEKDDTSETSSISEDTENQDIEDFEALIDDELERVTKETATITGELDCSGVQYAKDDSVEFDHTKPYQEARKMYDEYLNKNTTAEQKVIFQKVRLVEKEANRLKKLKLKETNWAEAETVFSDYIKAHVTKDERLTFEKYKGTKSQAVQLQRSCFKTQLSGYTDEQKEKANQYYKKTVQHLRNVQKRADRLAQTKEARAFELEKSIERNKKSVNKLRAQRILPICVGAECVDTAFDFTKSYQIAQKIYDQHMACHTTAEEKQVAIKVRAVKTEAGRLYKEILAQGGAIEDSVNAFDTYMSNYFNQEEIEVLYKYDAVKKEAFKLRKEALQEIVSSLTPLQQELAKAHIEIKLNAEFCAHKLVQRKAERKLARKTQQKLENLNVLIECAEEEIRAINGKE